MLGSSSLLFQIGVILARDRQNAFPQAGFAFLGGQRWVGNVSVDPSKVSRLPDLVLTGCVEKPSSIAHLGRNFYTRVI